MASRETPLVALIDMSAQMGGVEFSTLYLAERMHLRRIVFCPQEGPLPTLCRERHIPVQIVAAPQLMSTSLRVGQHRVPNPIAWIVNSLLLLMAIIRYSRSLAAAGVDLVCTKGMAAHFYGALAAHVVGIPCVIHMQDEISGSFYARVFALLARLFAAWVIADGKPIQDQLEPALGNTPVSVIHNGVDLQQFSPEVDGTAVREEWGVGGDELVVGNVARLVSWKGQDVLIRAFAEIAPRFPQARLVLVGDAVFAGDQFKAHLHKLVAELALQERVHFAGYRWDLPEVLSAFDIFAQTSRTKDTAPLAVVSAMASGKAIISTSVAGTAELFDPPRDALLVRPSSHRELAEVLARVLADPALRVHLAREARITAEMELSQGVFTERCEQVFQQVLAQRSSI